ncbi:N-acetylneuraminate synthase [Candidatus Uhrbacteria bacterium]|nr:N-acetylneuraminate synthase [Candidatus Uhrbacteria bacterium]
MHTFIIAEAGVNHNGDLEIAKKLVDAAVDAGADAVKFQTFRADQLVIASAVKAGYQIENTGTNESQAEMLRALELSAEAHRELVAYCAQTGIMFMSTPFDLESVDFLAGLGMSVFKIASGEITNLPLLRKIGGLGREVIMSTGMANMDEVEAALNVLVQAGTPKGKITVLHCHTDYPTQMQDVNLRAMLTMRDALGVKVGYSDHTPGIEIPIAAVALGASVIEKHFTLDRNMPGPDHKASLEPDELSAMVAAIRNVESALGDGVKRPTERELVLKAVGRKSIVASRDIAAGEMFSEDNLTTKRPGSGISAMQWDRVLGQKSRRDFRADELIEV